MKKAIVFLRPQNYRQTRQALEEAGFYGLSAVSVRGRGKKPVRLETVENGAQADSDDGHRFLPKKMVVVFLRDEDEERFVQAVLSVNRTGRAGDGKIFILPARQSIRIRTGEEGEDTLA